MKFTSSSPNVSTSEETNDSVTKPFLKESSPIGSKSIRKLSASNIVARRKVGVPVPLSASERAKEDEEEKKRKEKEKLLQIVPLRKLLGWLFSIARQYVPYYLCLFTTIILNNIGLLLVPRYIGKYVDTLNSSRPECLDCQILFYPVSEGTQALFYLSIAATMLAVGVGLRIICEEVTGATVCMDITKNLFRTVLQQEIDFFNENKSGTLLSRITNDVFIVRHIMGFSVGQASVYIVLLLGSGTLSFYTSYKLSLILIFIIVPLFGIIGMKLHSHIRWIANEIQNALASGVSFAEETLSAAETVKYLSSEAQSKNEFERLCNINFEFKKQKAKLFSGWALFISFIAASGVCACVWYASTLVQSGELSSGDLWTFIVYMAQSIVAVIILSVLYTDLTALIGGAQHVFELSQRIPKLDLNHGTVIRKEDWKGVVKFEHLNFCYPLVPDQMILSDINFELYPGKTLAIVGKSGSGKSTLAKLILGLYKPTRGKITIDGIDIHSLKSSYWRGKIGYVQQEPVLFSMSIFENIAFSSMLLAPENTSDSINTARENEKIKKRVEKVAKMANADGYILKLDHGYQTQVGERGAMLSGGQKQKIAIARALMKNPKILVLDEATSALDAKSEKKVQKALNDCLFGDKGFNKEHCTIIIAHRLSTVKIADEIIVIDKGEIVERGTHTELYQLGKIYKNLVENKQELT